jgi:hypothetical protein
MSQNQKGKVLYLSNAKGFAENRAKVDRRTKDDCGNLVNSEFFNFFNYAETPLVQEVGHFLIFSSHHYTVDQLRGWMQKEIEFLRTISNNEKEIQLEAEFKIARAVKLGALI